MHAVKRKLLSLIFLVSLGLAVAPLPTLQAQSNELQLSPTKTTLEAKAGDKKQVLITVKNLAPTTQKFNAAFNNFTSIGETGEPKIIDDANFAHGIKPWMSGLNSISLSTNASGNYTLNISIPAAAKPGTYYGLVSFGTGGTSASVGSLVFVNVGAISQQVALEEFITNGIKVDSQGQTAGKFAVRVKNTGNGFTTPTVKIEVLDDKKSVLETLDANKDGGGILPDGSIRRYEIDFSKKLEPNKTYSARVTVTAGNNKPLTQEKNFVDAPANTAPSSTQPSSAKKTNLLPLAGAAIALLVIMIVTVLLVKKRRKQLVRMPTAIPPLPTGQPLAPSNPIVGTTTSNQPPAGQPTPPTQPVNPNNDSPNQPIQ